MTQPLSSIATALHRRTTRHTTRVITCLITWLHAVHERARFQPDHGANVVETIMIVAGFAAIAGVLVLAVKGKVQNWIDQIP